MKQFQVGRSLNSSENRKKLLLLENIELLKSLRFTWNSKHVTAVASGKIRTKILKRNCYLDKWSGIKTVRDKTNNLIRNHDSEYSTHFQFRFQWTLMKECYSCEIIILWMGSEVYDVYLNAFHNFLKSQILYTFQFSMHDLVIINTLC